MSEQPPTYSVTVKGRNLTPRMEAMGITGMVQQLDGGWQATFKKYPDVSFGLPEPVVEWLMEKIAIGEGAELRATLARAASRPFGASLIAPERTKNKSN